MRVNVEFRRPARRTLPVLVAVALLLVPGTALASHLFPDVGNDNPFHNEIGNVANAGITAGFNDGGYHPAEPVTRQAMAAFMYRGFGRLAHDTSTPVNTTLTLNSGSPASTDFPIRDVTITVPGVSNSTNPLQLVYIHARINFQGAMSTSVVGCPCQFGLTLQDMTDNTFSPSLSTTFESSVHATYEYAVIGDWAVVVPPGPRTFRILMTMLKRQTTTNAASWTIMNTSSGTAMTFPFGPDGTAELNP